LSKEMTASRLDDRDEAGRYQLRQLARRFPLVAEECCVTLTLFGVAWEQGARAGLRSALIDWLDAALLGTSQSTAFELDLSAAELFCAVCIAERGLLKLADVQFGAEAGPAKEIVLRILGRERDVLMEGGTGQLRNTPSAKAGAQTAPDGKGGDVGSESMRSSSAARAFAHEIRNPLNGAQLHVTFLQRELSRIGGLDEALEAARIVSGEIQRVAELVHDFLETSAAPRRARVSLRALCLGAVQRVAGDAARAGVEVGADLGDEDCTLEGDLSKMDQVLLELLQRAVEAALANGGRVLLRARRQQGNAVIDIRQDGSQNEHAHAEFHVEMPLGPPERAAGATPRSNERLPKRIPT
jgi:signal transduction histidine kinase